LGSNRELFNLIEYFHLHTGALLARKVGDFILPFARWESIHQAAGSSHG